MKQNSPIKQQNKEDLVNQLLEKILEVSLNEGVALTNNYKFINYALEDDKSHFNYKNFDEVIQILLSSENSYFTSDEKLNFLYKTCMEVMKQEISHYFTKDDKKIY